MKKVFVALLILIFGSVLFVALFLLFSYLGFGDSGLAWTEQTLISENDTFCGVKVNSLTTEKLKNAGFQGTAQFQPIFRPAGCVGGNSCAGRGSMLYFPQRGVTVEINGSRFSQWSYCELTYLHISQDDVVYFYVTITEYNTQDQLTSSDACENPTSEFGDCSSETRIDVPDGREERIRFEKGNKRVYIIGYPYEPSKSYPREIIRSNAKVIARLIDDAIK